MYRTVFFCLLPTFNIPLYISFPMPFLISSLRPTILHSIFLPPLLFSFPSSPTLQPYLPSSQTFIKPSFPLPPNLQPFLPSFPTLTKSYLTFPFLYLTLTIPLPSTLPFIFPHPVLVCHFFFFLSTIAPTLKSLFFHPHSQLSFPTCCFLLIPTLFSLPLS